MGLSVLAALSIVAHARMTPGWNSNFIPTAAERNLRKLPISTTRPATETSEFISFKGRTSPIKEIDLTKATKAELKGMGIVLKQNHKKK